MRTFVRISDRYAVCVDHVTHAEYISEKRLMLYLVNGKNVEADEAFIPVVARTLGIEQPGFPHRK